MTPEAQALAWEIMADLADRSGIPEWLSDKEDPAALLVAEEIAEIIDRRVEQWRADG